MEAIIANFHKTNKMQFAGRLRKTQERRLLLAKKKPDFPIGRRACDIARAAEPCIGLVNGGEIAENQRSRQGKAGAVRVYCQNGR